MNITPNEKYKIAKNAFVKYLLHWNTSFSAFFTSRFPTKLLSIVFTICSYSGLLFGKNGFTVAVTAYLPEYKQYQFQLHPEEQHSV